MRTTRHRSSDVFSHEMRPHITVSVTSLVYHLPSSLMRLANREVAHRDTRRRSRHILRRSSPMSELSLRAPFDGFHTLQPAYPTAPGGNS